MVLLIDVEFLVGELMIDDIVTDALLQILVQLVVLANRICVLNVLLEVLSRLPHQRQSVPDFAHDITNQYYSCFLLEVPTICTRIITKISRLFVGKMSP